MPLNGDTRTHFTKLLTPLLERLQKSRDGESADFVFVTSYFRCCVSSRCCVINWQWPARIAENLLRSLLHRGPKESCMWCCEAIAVVEVWNATFLESKPKKLTPWWRSHFELCPNDCQDAVKKGDKSILDTIGNLYQKIKLTTKESACHYRTSIEFIGTHLSAILMFQLNKVPTHCSLVAGYGQCSQTFGYLSVWVWPWFDMQQPSVIIQHQKQIPDVCPETAILWRTFSIHGRLNPNPKQT